MPNSRDTKLEKAAEETKETDQDVAKEALLGEGTPILETGEVKVDTANHTVGGEPVDEQEIPKGVDSYLNTNFRITYDVPNTGGPGVPATQYSWNQGDIIVDDGTKIPHSEVAKLVKDGILVKVDSADKEED